MGLRKCKNVVIIIIFTHCKATMPFLGFPSIFCKTNLYIPFRYFRNEAADLLRGYHQQQELSDESYEIPTDIVDGEDLEADDAAAIWIDKRPSGSSSQSSNSKSSSSKRSSPSSYFFTGSTGRRDMEAKRAAFHNTMRLGRLCHFA